MNAADPVALLFGGMAKLGPGTDADTIHVLHQLPKRRFRVVDAGCGTGRQTLALARELGSPVHAIDSYQQFLDELLRRARDASVGELVAPHCVDMADIPLVFRDVDLLWSEGSAYNIGFANALATWAAALAPGGCAVISELSWLGKPGPRGSQGVFPIRLSRDARGGRQRSDRRSGGVPAADHTRVAATGMDRRLLRHPRPAREDTSQSPDPAVRDFAAETVREIEVFENSEDEYGYVFYVLELT